jgi:hypothetical protein
VASPGLQCLCAWLAGQTVCLPACPPARPPAWQAGHTVWLGSCSFSVPASALRCAPHADAHLLALLPTAFPPPHLQLGITSVFAEVLPAGKVDKVKVRSRIQLRSHPAAAFYSLPYAHNSMQLESTTPLPPLPDVPLLPCLLSAAAAAGAASQQPACCGNGGGWRQRLPCTSPGRSGHRCGQRYRCVHLIAHRVCFCTTATHPSSLSQSVHTPALRCKAPPPTTINPASFLPPPPPQ